MKKNLSKFTETILCITTILMAITIVILPGIKAIAAPNTPGNEMKSLVDVAESPVAEKILALVNDGILPVSEKDGDVYFHPDEKVTREYIATVLAKLTGVNTKTYEKSQLNVIDIEEISSENLPYVKAAAFSGLISVYSDTVGNYDVLSFCPKEEVTKQELAGMLGNLIKKAASSSKIDEFTDKNEISDIYIGSIEKLLCLEIISGYDDGTFRPKSNVTREELADMIYNIKYGGHLGK